MVKFLKKILQFFKMIKLKFNLGGMKKKKKA